MLNYYLARFFKEYPEYTGCSYETTVEQMSNIYNITVTVDEICKLYIPYSREDSYTLIKDYV